MVRINLVCVLWAGWRRNGDDKYNANRSLYARMQVGMLNTLPHNLTQITFCIPHCPNEPKDFKDFVKRIPPKIQNADVVIIRTENRKASPYWNYNVVFQKYHSSFDYYLLCEDDYIFVQPNFDKILLEMMPKQCGFICSRMAVQKKPGDAYYHNRPLASVSNGLVASWALEKVWQKYGFLPWEGQVDFSDGFVETGVKMCDTGSVYRTPFYGDNSCAWFYYFNEEDLIVPVQCFLDQSKFRQTFLPSSWPEWYPLAKPVECFTDDAKLKECFNIG